jgi:phosphate:Na+ symporter
MQYGFTDILQLLGALGLFLFGMKVMSEALMNLAGKKMRSILASMTSNRFLGVLTGFLITSIIQSSSATTLMVVSFSNASLLTLTESIAVIMGANIGTTITAWLITLLGFKVSMSAVALPLVGLGLLITFSKRVQSKNWGSFIIGFALLFIGLQFLKEAMPNIHQNPGILEFFKKYADFGFWSVLLFLALGTVLTVIIQSSSATMALTLVMTAEGWIPYEMAAAMVLGENIGTTITANIAALVANVQAKRTARAHLIFNVIGVVWMLLLFVPFVKMVGWLAYKMGSGSPYISATAIPVSISLFHTIFNILNTFLLIWFITPISRLVEKMVPEKAVLEKAIDEPKYLNKKILRFPETAIASLIDESKYLFENAIFEIVAHAMNIHREDILSDLKIKHVIRKSNRDFQVDVRELYLIKVKNIYGEIIKYAATAQSELKLTADQNNRIMEIKLANRSMVEIIKDVGDFSKNVTKYLDSENHYVKEEYDQFRKKMIKILRVVYLFRTVDDQTKYDVKFMNLKKEAKKNIRSWNIKIDNLIREDLVTVEMASSLVNDNANVNNIIDKLILVAELLYGKRDPIMDTAILSNDTALSTMGSI